MNGNKKKKGKGKGKNMENKKLSPYQEKIMDYRDRLSDEMRMRGENLFIMVDLRTEMIRVTEAEKNENGNIGFKKNGNELGYKNGSLYYRQKNEKRTGKLAEDCNRVLPEEANLLPYPYNYIAKETLKELGATDRERARHKETVER